MNGAFLHLAVNHIPVVGLPICFLLLAAGVLKSSRDLLQAGYVGIVLVALITLVTVKSGGPAAHVVRDMTGVTRESIHDHALAADKVSDAMNVLGGVALIGLWFLRRPNGVPAALTALMLIGSLALSIGFIRVAHLGGLIRHPEIEAGVGEKR